MAVGCCGVLAVVLVVVEVMMVAGLVVVVVVGLVGLVVEAVVTSAALDCAVPTGKSCPTGTHRAKP